MCDTQGARGTGLCEAADQGFSIITGLITFTEDTEELHNWPGLGSREGEREALLDNDQDIVTKLSTQMS